MIVKNISKVALLFIFGTMFSDVAKSVSTCSTALPIQEAQNSNWDTAVFSPSSRDLWLSFTAVSSQGSLSFSSAVGQGAHPHRIFLYNGTCNGLQLLDTLVYFQDSILAMSNLTIGENYFVLVQRGDPAVCTRVGCTYSERSILYQLKFFLNVVDCLDGIISGGTLPAPGPINLEYFAFNAYYFSQGFTMFECETLCLSAACNNSTLLNFLDFYDVTVTGPSGVFNDAAILALGGCFSNLLPGNYQMTFTDNGNVNFLGTVPFTVIPENHSSVDVSISTSSVICSPSDFLASISVSGLSYYEYVDYIIDGVVVNINNLPSSAFTEGVHEFCVEGLDRCSEDPDRDCVFYTVQAVPSFATIVDCNTVQITNNTTCSQLVNSWFWNFGNGQTSTSVNPPQVTYATGGTYTITLTITTNGGNTYSYSQTVQVNSLPQGLITGNDNLCSTSAFNYVLSGIVPGTINWYVFPASAGNVFSGINSSTATVVWNSGWNGLAIVGASGVDANGCPFDVSIKINPCCLPISSLPSGANFSDPSATTNVSSYYSIWPFVVGGGSGQLTGQTVYIYNDLVIDQTTSFVNCTLYVAPGKRILVAPGRTISFLNGLVTAMCDEMWNGVIASTITSSIFARGTSFQQGINALVSESGASLSAGSCTFFNDHKGIVVRNYTQITPPVFFEVFQNRFETTGALFPPHAGQQMHKGIEVLNMSSITIGSTVNSQANEFRNMDYGVHINNGNVRLYNNIFFSIQTVPGSFVCPSCICPGGTAVCGIRSGFSGIVPLPIQVGDLNVGNVFRANRFVNSKYGVFTRGNYDVGIRNNNFAFVAYCAELNSSNSRIITIRDNAFGNFNVANGLFNVPNSNITISNNVYTNGSGFVFPFVGNTAVYINHNLIQPFTAKIENNTISRVRQGIYIINANGLTFSGTPKILIRSNTINFNQLTGGTQPGVFHSGIRLESCYQVNVWTNSISKPGANPGLGMVGNLRGVHVSQSPLTVVFKNEFVRMAEGVWTFGNCYPSFFNCNTHRQNYYGYNFAGPADIGNQTGAFPNEIPTGNRWIAPVISNGDLFGQIAQIAPNTPIDWWYKAGAFTFPQSGNLITGSLSGGPLLTEAILTTNNDVCGPLPINPPIIDKREWQLGKIVRREKDTSFAELNYFDRRSAIMQLREDPSLLFLGTSDDSLYQNYLLQNAFLPGGRLDLVNRNLANSDTAGAIAENNLVSSQIYWEERIKRANSIILSSISSDSLSSADSTELWNLAFENSLYSGPGVFSARAFFRLDITDEADGQVRSAGNNESSNMEDPVKPINIYPNPVTDIVFIDLTEHVGINGIINIRDINGRIVFQRESVFKGVEEISLKARLNPGIYFIEVLGGPLDCRPIKFILID